MNPGSQTDSHERPRSTDRATFDAPAEIRRSSGRSFPVRIFDLSPQGCKTECVEQPEVGERVWLRFDTLERVEATVGWVAGHIGGVQFERAIHEAVFERLTRAKGPS